jgi:hypothetical protein
MGAPPLPGVGDCLEAMIVLRPDPSPTAEAMGHPSQGWPTSLEVGDTNGASIRGRL